MSETLQAAHPFGSSISSDELLRRFSDCRQWEDRLRQLILLSRLLPALPEALKTPHTALAGCESRVWLGHQVLADGRLHFFADSEGRIVKGLLAIVLCTVEGKTPAQLQGQDPLALFDRLGLADELSASRADGLAAIVGRIRTLATGAA